MDHLHPSLPVLAWFFLPRQLIHYIWKCGCVVCVTKLIHHCCQHTLSLQNAFRNFQQRSFERKHGIVLKKYSPEDNQKSKLAKNPKPLFHWNVYCCFFRYLWSLWFISVLKDFLFCFSPHVMQLYFILLLLLSCMYWQTACAFIAVLRSRLILYFSLNNSFSHLQKKKMLRIWNFISN